MKDDGGPAFPRKLPDVQVAPSRALEIIKEYAGMSLRDYFAAAALTAIAGSADFMADAKKLHPIMAAEEIAASISYHLADAMLEERNRESS